MVILKKESKLLSAFNLKDERHFTFLTYVDS